MHKTLLFAGCALLLASTSACSSLGLTGIPGAPATGSDLNTALTNFNNAVANNCTGNFNFTWAPPLPPSGSAGLSCVAKPTAAPIMVPLSQVGSLLPTPAAAAPSK